MDKEFSDRISHMLPRYCEGDVSPEERIRVEEWIHSSEENYRVAKQIHSIYLAADTMHVLEKVDTEKALEKVSSRMSAPPRSGWLTGWRRVAAVLLVLLATAATVRLYTVRQTRMPDMTVCVEKGQKVNLTLPDGSRVWINSDSRLSYGSRFNEEERVLTLEGEAYFEVAPDKNRPFKVETPELTVTALGTRFNVKSYASESLVSATLMSGAVAVESAYGRQTLAPSEQLVYDKSTRRMQKKEVSEVTACSAWRYNSLRFEAETFESIVRTLERNYNTRIIFESESLKGYRFTGTAGNTSLESVLQILSLTSPLSYEVKDSVIVLRENIKQKAYYERALK